MVSILLFMGFTYLYFHTQDTLTIGIYSGSSWDVPGTDQYEIFQQAIEKFHEKYPNISVVYEEGIPADDYSEWLSSKILTGEVPDVFLVLQEDFTNLSERNVLESLNSRILKDDDFDSEVFYETCYSAGSQGSIQYALPLRCNPTMMFVNKTLLKEEGIDMPEQDWTWSDFYKICSLVTKDTDGDGRLDQFGSYGYGWLDAVYSNGSQPFNGSSEESNFTSSNVMDAISFVKKLEALNENYQISSEDFDLGHVAFQPLTFAEYRTYMPYPWRIKKYSQFEWNCVAMPAGPSGGNQSSMDTLMVAMSSQSNCKNMAWEFMKILTMDEENQYTAYKYSAGASVLKSVTSSDQVQEILNKDSQGDETERIDMTMIDQVIRQSVSPTYFKGYEDALQYADNYIENVIRTDEEMNLSMFELEQNLKHLLE